MAGWRDGPCSRSTALATEWCDTGVRKFLVEARQEVLLALQAIGPLSQPLNSATAV
jgi:hypothetical protein